MARDHTHPRVAVVGCGHWGANHVRAWSQLGLLRAVCDPDPVRLKVALAAAPEVLAVEHPDELAARDDVDAVVIATPAATHARLAVQFLDAGKDVLVEKPMATNAADARALLDAASANGRMLMVGHVLEYHPAVLRLRSLVDEGVLGPVRYLYANRLNFGRLRTEESALWSFAPHDIALILRLVGTPPIDVTCRGAAWLSEEVADVTVMTLSFPAGVRAHAFVSWLHPFKEQRLVVVGEDQMAVFDDTAPWDEKLVLFPHQVDWLNGGVPVARRAEGVPVALEPEEPLVAECRHFAQAVRDRRPPHTDGTSALQVLEVLEAGQRSLGSGGDRVVVGVGGSPPPAAAFVHPSAVVDDGAFIGAGSSVWHFTHVMPGARIGTSCTLGQNVFVGRGVRIGDGVKVQNNVSVYEGVELEDHVFCGPSVVFTNVVRPRAEVDRRQDYGVTLVRRGASIGANATIVSGVEVGSYALVGAGAVVTKDVPPHAVVAGVPAEVVGWACRCGEGLDRVGDGLVCETCGLAYRRRGGGLGPDGS